MLQAKRVHYVISHEKFFKNTINKLTLSTALSAYCEYCLGRNCGANKHQSAVTFSPGT